MKVKVLDIHKVEKGSKELPVHFNVYVRDDLIQRAVLAVQSEKRQAYGTKPGAGLRQVSKVSRRRRDYKGTYGIGISRVPRKIMSRSGTQMNWVGAIMPGTVGGRQAYPPTAKKIWSQKINEKENRKAIRSAIAATIYPDIVKGRGHLIPKEFPFILDSKIESVAKTKQVESILEKIGFANEIERTSKSKVRAGSGKNRGRKYQNKIGPLFVVSSNCPLIKAAKNIPGVDVVQVQNLNAELLAPGCHAGRLTLWSEASIDRLAKENLFAEEYQGPKHEKTVKEVKKIEQVKPQVKKIQKKVKAK